MKKPVIILSLYVAISSISFGQTFKEQFNDLGAKKDTAGQRVLLKKWEQSDSTDAELYVAYFNYYINKSRQEVVRMDNNPKGEKSLQIMDQDTTKKEPVAYIHSEIFFEPEIIKKGFDKIDKGIAHYPTRLDMRFGKIFMMGKVEEYEIFTNEIIKTIDYSVSIDNKWMWGDNKLLDDGKKFMLQAIQDYQIQLYDTENDDLLHNMKRIAERALKYYPDHVESLSNLSIVYLLWQQIRQGIGTPAQSGKIST